MWWEKADLEMQQENVEAAPEEAMLEVGARCRQQNADEMNSLKIRRRIRKGPAAR